MSKKFFCLLICLSMLLVLPSFWVAGASVQLSVAADSASAYLSVSQESKSTHALRAVLLERYTEGLEHAALTLTFTGNQPSEKTFPYEDWTLYRTLNAGNNRYAAQDGARLYAVELSGLANGSWERCTFLITENEKILYQASITYNDLCTASGLTLLPVWNNSTADWMAQLPDSVSLSDLTVPGTHDSGAIRSDAIGKLSQCQSLSITDQLTCGVRFLDIRLKLSSSTLKVYHGVVDQKLSFSEIRSACIEFLEAHPDEVILMSIKQEGNAAAGFSEAVKSAIEADSDYWYTGDSLPALEQVRGKIVLFARYDSGGMGINCNNGWADNTDFTMNNGVPMKVQDYYNIEKSANIDEKWNKIKALAEFAHSSSKGTTLCLNFTSGYTGLTNITAVSDVINPQLTEYFAAAESGCYGVFAIDFVTPELASALIAVNFPPANS